MVKEPWDLPVEEASRPILQALIDQYNEEQKARELGICCSRMAHLLTHIGSMDEAAKFGQQAIHYLRQTDDKRELAKTLRLACVPFSFGPHREWLEESLAISREIGDREQEGWTLYRFTRAMTPPRDLLKQWESLSEEHKMERMREFKKSACGGHTVEEALAVFEEIDHPVGIATCLVSLGVERKPSDRALFDRAIELYERAGDVDGADKARKMADVFCGQ